MAKSMTTSRARPRRAAAALFRYGRTNEKSVKRGLMSAGDAISPRVPEFVKSGDDFVPGQDPYDKQDQGGK
jgi:hypothetical protein